MPKIAKQQKSVPVIEKRIYTEEELKKFDGMIQKYFEDQTLSNGEVVRVLNYKKLAIAYGALSKDGGVIITGIVRKYGSIESYTRPTRYEQFENLMAQHDYWKSGLDWKKKIFEKRQEEHYEKILEESGNEQSAEDSLF